jgi:hypothetical protein
MDTIVRIDFYLGDLTLNPKRMVGVFLIATDGKGAAPSMLAALNLQTPFVMWRSPSPSADRISTQFLRAAAEKVMEYRSLSILCDPLQAPEGWSKVIAQRCRAESNIIMVASTTFINALLEYVAEGTIFDIPDVSVSHINVGVEGEVKLKQVGVTFPSPTIPPATRRPPAPRSTFRRPATRTQIPTGSQKGTTVEPCTQTSKYLARVWENSYEPLHPTPLPSEIRAQQLKDLDAELEAYMAQDPRRSI